MVCTSTDGVEGAHEASIEARPPASTIPRHEPIEPTKRVAKVIPLSLEFRHASFRFRQCRIGRATPRIGIGGDARLDLRPARGAALRIKRRADP